jgi:hypothetical protein
MSADENTRLVAGNQKNFRSLEENLEITSGLVNILLKCLLLLLTLLVLIIIATIQRKNPRHTAHLVVTTS